VTTEARTIPPRTPGAPEPPGGARVSLEHLSRSYAGVKALDDLSLTVEPGELVALLGPSGCGKTTALRVLAGFERVDAGRVVVDGRDLSRLSPQKRDMGMVFQSYSLFPNLSARDNVAFGLRLRRQRSAQRRASAEAQLALVGLTEHATKYPHQLSGGQQQRVALARALAIEPRVLLLDEPLSALDAKVRVELREQIRALQQRLQITTIFVTHDQEEALSMADRVCVMREGHVEQLATPEVLYRAPSSAFVAAFVGTSSRLPAVRHGDEAVVLGTACPIRPGTVRPTGPAEALLRPEDLGVRLDPDGACTVVARTFFGGTTRLDVLIGAAICKIDVRSDDAAPFEPSARVEVELRARDVLLVDAG